MTQKALQYIAKMILTTVLLCQFGNVVQAAVTEPSKIHVNHVWEDVEAHSNNSMSGHQHGADTSDETCCIDADEGRSEFDVNLDLYLPSSGCVEAVAVIVSSEMMRRFINLKPIFPPLYLLFQSFLE